MALKSENLSSLGLDGVRCGLTHKYYIRTEEALKVRTLSVISLWDWL